MAVNLTWDSLVKTGKLMYWVMILPVLSVAQTRRVARGTMLELRLRWKVLTLKCPRCMAPVSVTWPAVMRV